MQISLYGVLNIFIVNRLESLANVPESYLCDITPRREICPQTDVIRRVFNQRYSHYSIDSSPAQGSIYFIIRVDNIAIINVHIDLAGIEILVPEYFLYVPRVKIRLNSPHP